VALLAVLTAAAASRIAGFAFSPIRAAKRDSGFGQET
jgi:hypothetical protein